MKIFPKTPTTNILVQELEKELLVYDLQTNKAFCLNETSAMIYQLCDGTRTVADISNLMSRKLKTLVSEDFVWLALNEIKKDGLLENDAQLSRYFERFSRREIIKKVGLTSMIALPFITSVIAPKAVMAQSCTPFSVSCTFNAYTQSDCCPTYRCDFTRVVTPICTTCQSSGNGFTACGFVGGCQNCNTVSIKNRCCNTSATATDDGFFCLCG